MTFKGTNTYIVGTRTLAVIDPGPGKVDPDHCAAILRAAAGRPISHIVLTHTHHDHYDTLAELAAATKALVAGFGRKPAADRPTRIGADGREASTVTFEPDIVLRDGDMLAGDGWRLRALHTPGHAPDHLCFALEGTGALLSGDHVMAWNTSVVIPPDGRMSDYMASLEKLRGRGDTLYLPGHGGKLAEPERMVRAYLIHRRMREDSILGAIRERPRPIAEIVTLLYPGLDPKLVKAATFSVEAHVEHLIEKGLVAGGDPSRADRPLYPA
jgi:glyoxylase-like metal-dependent hydrolase (beta-lactamase superfamily II)